jgi:hypothetical protein
VDTQHPSPRTNRTSRFTGSPSLDAVFSAGSSGEAAALAAQKAKEAAALAAQKASNVLGFLKNSVAGTQVGDTLSAPPPPPPPPY